MLLFIKLKEDELYIKEDLDDSFKNNHKDLDKQNGNLITSSKSNTQLNANSLPRVKFLSDYELSNRLFDENEKQKQPLLSDKNKTIIEMENADSWLDEAGGLIIKKNKSDIKTDEKGF